MIFMCIYVHAFLFFQNILVFFQHVFCILEESFVLQMLTFQSKKTVFCFLTQLFLHCLHFSSTLLFFNCIKNIEIYILEAENRNVVVPRFSKYFKIGNASEQQQQIFLQISATKYFVLKERKRKHLKDSLYTSIQTFNHSFSAFTPYCKSGFIS